MKQWVVERNNRLLLERRAYDDRAKAERRPEAGQAQNPKYDNFQRLLEGVLSVLKEEVDRRREEYERARE